MFSKLLTRSRPVWVLSILLGMVLSLTAATSGIAKTSKITGHRRGGFAITSSKPVPKFHGKLPPPSFADEVSTIAAEYPKAFAGIVAATPGMLTIYVVRSKAAAFLDAVRRLTNSPHTGTTNYKLISVPHSWAQLLAVTARITSQSLTSPD